MSDLSSGGVTSVRNECRSAQTLTVSMSRSRLFLGGLLSSRARLRFAGLSIIVDPKHFTLQVDLCVLGHYRVALLWRDSWFAFHTVAGAP
jgi:hypothetical protein